jgi:glycolate oxidase FAD binding subunit
MQIEEIVKFIKNNDKVKIGENFDINNYSGVVSYYPEELVITVKSGTNNQELTKLLAENNQGFDFYIDENKTIGASYNIGGSEIRNSVLGIQVIDGNGDILNFGGEVMKNVAGYDVSRLLCGAGGKCGIITQISFKVLPLKAIDKKIKPEFMQIDEKLQNINKKISQVFDPKGKFSNN